jgi:hypothetical protein
MHPMNLMYQNILFKAGDHTRHVLQAAPPASVLLAALCYCSTSVPGEGNALHQLYKFSVRGFSVYGNNRRQFVALQALD